MTQTDVEEQISFSELIEQIKSLDQQAANLAKQEKVIREERKTLARELIARMQDMGTESVSGAGYGAYLQPKKYPNITDWESFGAFILENNALYLLQRRVNSSALIELVDVEEKEVPGLEFFEQVDVAIRKR